MQTSKTCNSSSTGRGVTLTCTNNIIYQLQFKHCLKGCIDKTTTPLRLQTNNQITSVVHQNSNLPVSAHTLEHKITILENCYSLKGIFKHEDPVINDDNFKNIEIALQLTYFKIKRSLWLEKVKKLFYFKC